MRSLSIRQARQSFSQILRDAENGASTVIARRGKPIAVIAPVRRPLSPERERAIEHVIRLMREGLPIGGRRFTRDEMHER